MAPKSPSPMEDPPVASSSEEDEEEELSSSEEEEAEEKEEDSSSGEEDDKDDDDGDSSRKQQKSEPTATAAVKPQASESESESETESVSDTEPQPEAKAIVPKLTEERKPVLASPVKSGAKRPGKAAEEEVSRESKRQKKEDNVELEEKKPGEDTKKQHFHRLWKVDDEIALLRGMLDYASEKGVNPFDDMNGFYEFIKKFISFEVSKVQLMDKIRGLKKRYVNNLSKGKNGEDPTFSKEHDKKAFDLSKKIWGIEGMALESAVKTNGKARKIQKGKSKLLDSLRGELFSEPSVRDEAKESEGAEVMSRRKIVGADMVVPVDKIMARAGMDEAAVRKTWDLIPFEVKKDLEAEWKRLRVCELNLFSQRVELMQELVKMITKALNNS